MGMRQAECIPIDCVVVTEADRDKRRSWLVRVFHAI